MREAMAVASKSRAALLMLRHRTGVNNPWGRLMSHTAAPGHVSHGRAWSCLTAASQAADEAAARVEDSLGDEGPPELDEFGRNVNMQREREARERRWEIMML